MVKSHFLKTKKKGGIVLKIIFMGTPDFAVESLRKLKESKHNIQAVISQPDRKK